MECRVCKGRDYLVCTHTENFVFYVFVPIPCFLVQLTLESHGGYGTPEEWKIHGIRSQPSESPVPHPRIQPTSDGVVLYLLKKKSSYK